MGMTNREAAVVDPILSTQARGYENDEFIGNKIFPQVDIPNRSMKVIKFGKEGFRKRDTRRAPGAETLRVEFGYASDPVALKQEALEGIVPAETAEEASKIPGVDLGAEAVKMVQDIIALGRECEQADLARNPANYPAGHVAAPTGNDKWSASTSDPKVQLDDLRSTIRRKIGRYANVLAIGAPVFEKMTNHAKVREQFKYVSAESITEVMLARYLQLDEVIVGKGVFLPESTDDSAEATDIWGKDGILFFRPKGSSYRVPSFGYTYRLKGYPLVEQPYYERNRKSWVYPTTEEFRPYIVGSDAGALLQNLV